MTITACSLCGNFLDDSGECGECSNFDNSAMIHQIGGDHYRSKKVQPIEYIMANDMPFADGNVVKYVSRHRQKNGAEDIKKGIQYFLFILENEYGQKYEF